MVDDRLETIVRAVDPARGHPRMVARLQVFWNFVEGLAGLSCCRRLGVGCVAVTPDLTEVLSIGYNGPPVGADNDSCRGVQGDCGCAHAEGNVLSKLKGDLGGLAMLTTTLQCEHCAGLVANSRRFRYVIYGSEYRDRRGRQVLQSAGLVVAAASGLGLVGDMVIQPGPMQ